jgi:hypothetical protein
VRRGAAAILIAVAGLAVAPAAQSPAAIGIFASVEAANGVPLEGLTAEDFVVTSGGTPVAFTLASAGPQPLDTLLLADLTTSVTGRVRTIVAMPWPETFSLAADRLITDLRSSDRARIVAVLGARLVPSPAWTNDRLALQRGVRVFTLPDGPVEPSPLWDALDEGLALFPSDRDRRRHILLVSDGRATANRASSAEVAERAVLADVAISAIELDPPARSLSLPHSDQTPGPRAFLERLTARTGGVYRFVTADARGTHQTRTPVGQILDLMRTSYRLSVTPPTTTAERTLEVRVTRPGLTVRARTGY